MPKYNKEQQAAIDLRGKTILVSAPAGSGKTRILVARLISLIVNDHYSMDQFLVLTFTKAAGNEMKQRLNVSLHEEALANHDEETLRHIQEQIQLLPHAYITTFDSFCKTLLEKYGYLIGVMPGFKVNPSPDLIKDQVLDQCLEKWVENPDFKDYAYRHNTKNNFDDLKKTLIDFQNITNSFVDFHQFLDQVHERYYDFNLSRNMPILEGMTQLYRDCCLKSLSAYNILYRFCEKHDITYFFETVENAKKPAPATALYDYYSDLYDALNRPLTFDTLNSLLSQKLEMASIKWSELGVDDSVKKQYTKLKGNVTDPLSKLKKFLSYTSTEELKKYLDYSFKDIEFLLGKDGLLDQFNKDYSEAKKARNELDFHDLEEYATRLLQPDLPVVERLNHTLKEIMVDEYQDTNEMQENLVLKIANYDEHIPMFMVGDMKQSIYRFRQADPSIFQYKFDTFTKLEEMTEYDTNIRIDLKYNYRSEKVVLDSVNYIFDCIMDSSVGGLEYIHGDNAILRYDFDAKGTTLPELEKNHDFDTDILISLYNNQEEYTKSEVEAHMVAQKIIQMRQVTDYKYHDFAVLMRATTEFITYKKVFERYHIPANITLSSGLFESNEVISMMTLLKALVNPYDDIAMLSVLHNNFLFSHFTENELLDIRDADDPLYINLTHHTNKKVLHFLEVFDDLRDTAMTSSPYETLKKCLKETGYQAFVSQLMNGEQRSANLDILLETFRTNEEYPYLKDYLELLDSSSSQAPGFIASDENDAVEFMTIHKSKGLQFPVVFVSAMQKKFNSSDEKAEIIISQHDGVAGSVARKEKSPFGPILCKYEHPYLKMLKLLIRQETVNEEMRILYVALTRAEKKLILTGTIKDEEEIISIARKVQANDTDPTLNRGQGVVYNLAMRSTNNYLDWVIMALLRHKDFQKDIRRAIPEISPYLSLDRSSFEELENDDTYLARFHCVIQDSSETINKIPAYAKIKATNQYRAYKKYYDFEYPYPVEPRSIAVTSMEEMKNDDTHFDFSNEGTHYLATDRGTLVHNLLSYFNFKEDDPQELIQSLYSNQMFDEEGLSVLKNYLPHINDFINSDTYQLIKDADQIYQEKQFRYKDENGLIINGIFDLVFIKDNKVYVLDYKTDRVSKDNSDETLKDLHRTQLSYYSKVLKEVFHTDVQPIIYYLHINKAIYL